MNNVLSTGTTAFIRPGWFAAAIQHPGEFPAGIAVPPTVGTSVLPSAGGRKGQKKFVVEFCRWILLLNFVSGFYC